MAECSSCNTEIVAGTRWCAICHTSVVRPEIGRLASPGKRLGAYFFDFALPLAFIIIVIVVLGAGTADIDSTDLAAAPIIPLLGILLLIGYGIWALVLFCKGTTPGKKILGMRVVKEDGGSAGFFTMLIRELVGKSISGLVFSIGFLWILFDRDHQGWHDKLMRTYVIEHSNH